MSFSSRVSLGLSIVCGGMMEGVGAQDASLDLRGREGGSRSTRQVTGLFTGVIKPCPLSPHPMGSVGAGGWRQAHETQSHNGPQEGDDERGHSSQGK